MSKKTGFLGRIIVNIHRWLVKIGPLSPLLLFVSKIKGFIFKKDFEGKLIKIMPKDWRKMTILDLGCGPCNKEKDQRFGGVNIICVDIYKPYLAKCNKLGFETISADIRKINHFFSENSVDIIWLIDVLEHLEKEDGFMVLRKAEKIARKQVIVFCPIGDVPQDAEGGNRFQRHISVWKESDFKKNGYQCEVLRSYHGDIRHAAELHSQELYPVSADAMWAVKNLFQSRQ